MAKRRAVLLLLAIILPAAAWLATTAGDDPPEEGPNSPPPAAQQSQPEPSGLDLPAIDPQPRTYRSVARALQWLARHQQPEGNWGTQDFRQQCEDEPCSGPGELKADGAATAAALLTFLAAGQMPNKKGPYQQNMRRGFDYLIKSQRTDGRLTESTDPLLAGHSLTTLALCEGFGVSSDINFGATAQTGVDFLERTSLPEIDHWQYRPGREGDSSAIVWQMLALRSGQLNGLEVDKAKLEARAKWLREKTLAADDSDIAAAAAGLLAAQALDAAADAPDVIEFVRRLLAAPPARNKPRDCVAWLFASQALQAAWKHTWWRKLRVVLAEDQIKQGCGDGSWSPEKPVADAWGRDQGRVFVTAMSTFSLEVPSNNLESFRRPRLWQDPAAPAADKTPR